MNLIDSKYVLLVLSLTCLFEMGRAQQSQGTGQGKIVDAQFLSIGGVFVKNVRSGQISTTDLSGHFSIPAENGDSLMFVAMGYELTSMVYQPDNDWVIQMKRIDFQLDEVMVYDFKNWEDFKKEFLALDLMANEVNVVGLPNAPKNPIPTKYRSDLFPRRSPRVLNYVFNPVSSITYWTNKEEKRKRNMLKKINQEKQEQVYWALMTSEKIKEVTDISDALCPAFILYCNQNITDKTLTDQYLYLERIGDLYVLFMQEKEKK